MVQLDLNISLQFRRKMDLKIPIQKTNYTTRPTTKLHVSSILRQTRPLRSLSCTKRDQHQSKQLSSVPEDVIEPRPPPALDPVRFNASGPGPRIRDCLVGHYGRPNSVIDQRWWWFLDVRTGITRYLTCLTYLKPPYPHLLSLLRHCHGYLRI